MSYISVRECLPGMLLGKAVTNTNNGKLLLNSGAILNNAIIDRLISLEIREIDIADAFSLYITPSQKMGIHIENLYLSYIDKYSSSRIEGNMSDKVIPVVKILKKLLPTICKQDKILDYCVQLNITSTPRFLDMSVLTSVFSGLVAGMLDLSLEQIYEVMVGGLLHDIGCLEMPFLIGVDSLVGQQELLWKEHPTYGYYFAMQNEFSKPIADIILKHHENWNGSGYPNGLSGEESPISCRIVSLCQMIAENLILKQMKPYETLEIAYGTSGIYYDKNVVNTFVNNISLYPMGSLVRLSTDEVGIITNIRKNKGPRPIVNVFFNRFGKPLTSPKIMDLGQERTLFIKEILS